MGWIAINQANEVLQEDTHGRPVQQGEEGNLKFILQEDFNQKVAVDLTNGVIIIGYDGYGFQGGDVEIYNPRTVFYICDETSILAENITSEFYDPQPNGDVKVRYHRPMWRPIWFTRYTNGTPTKIIGAQTTLSPDYGSRNVKKLISIFADGRIGID